MTTYRSSLGTRGELRRIAAEAETATIEHVRPWKRKLQPCKFAPHVMIPQWVRGEHVVNKETEVDMALGGALGGEVVVRGILKALMDEVCKSPPPRRVVTRGSVGGADRMEVDGRGS